MMKYRQVMRHNLMTYRTHRSHVHRRGQIKTMTKIKRRTDNVMKGLVMKMEITKSRPTTPK